MEASVTRCTLVTTSSSDPGAALAPPRAGADAELTAATHCSVRFGGRAGDRAGSRLVLGPPLQDAGSGASPADPRETDRRFTQNVGGDSASLVLSLDPSHFEARLLPVGIRLTIRLDRPLDPSVRIRAEDHRRRSTRA